MFNNVTTDNKKQIFFLPLLNPEAHEKKFIKSLAYPSYLRQVLTDVIDKGKIYTN